MSIKNKFFHSTNIYWILIWVLGTVAYLKGTNINETDPAFCDTTVCCDYNKCGKYC